MYCVKCGVELADSEKVCPLCGTRAFHPDMPPQQGEPPYPPDPRPHMEEVSRSGVLFILTVLALLPAVLFILCDWRINGTIVWSGYASGGVALLYINFATGGHWFLSFAFPVTGAIGLLVTAMVTLLRYLPGGHLYVVGGGLILSGGLAVLIEFLINLTFRLHETFFWSLYPLAAGVILGGMLLAVAGCKPLRQSLHRKFFI